MGFSVYQGNDIAVTTTVQDSEGNPVDISGANEIILVITESGDSTSTEHLRKTLTGGGLTILNSTDFQFDLSDAETGNLAVGSYYVEAELTNSNGKIYTILQSGLTINSTYL